jgi:coenzyme F420-reducing hydrogenase beta subunit
MWLYKRIDREENLNKILGSKYVRSIISKETSFYSILEDLKKDKFVLFSGVGCQIYALRNYLKKNNCSEEKLITIEVLCHGTPAAIVWESYKNFMERKYKSVITDINFRDKKYGWNSYSMYMKFKNGKVYRKL